jgi:hypothetical protein
LSDGFVKNHKKVNIVKKVLIFSLILVAAILQSCAFAPDHFVKETDNGTWISIFIREDLDYGYVLARGADGAGVSYPD